jgi:hypothetical protein
LREYTDEHAMCRKPEAIKELYEFSNETRMIVSACRSELVASAGMYAYVCLCVGVIPFCARSTTPWLHTATLTARHHQAP